MAKKLLILWGLAALLALAGCGASGSSPAAEASREEAPASSLPQSQPGGSDSSGAEIAEAEPAESASTGDDGASEGNPAESSSSVAGDPEAEPAAGESPVLKITVGEHEFLADFASNPSAQEFQELLAQGPVTIQMEDYGGFEKVGPLGTSLTPSDESITTQPGDVILYQGSQITIYYGTNTWTFTRLAKIRDPQDLKEKLGEGAVQAVFSLEGESGD